MGDQEPTRDWVGDTLRVLGELTPPGEVLRPIRVPIEADEAEWFVRGHEAGLYPIDGCPTPGSSTCEPGRSDHFLTTTGKPRHVLTHGKDGWSLSREYVTHLGAYARSVLAFGYPSSDALVSHYSQYRRDLVTKVKGGNYELDVVYPTRDGYRLLIEAKAEPKPVAKWAAAIDRGATPTDLVALGFKEVEYVLDLEPEYLWLVGPGTVDPAAHVWSVAVDGIEATFTRVADVPSPRAR